MFRCFYKSQFFFRDGSCVSACRRLFFDVALTLCGPITTIVVEERSLVGGDAGERLLSWRLDGNILSAQFKFDAGAKKLQMYMFSR